MKADKVVTLPLEEYNELLGNVSKIMDGKTCHIEMSHHAYITGFKRNTRVAYNGMCDFITNEDAINIASNIANAMTIEFNESQDKLEEKITEIIKLKELSIFGFIKFKLRGNKFN